MAGIGFALRRLTQQDNLIGIVSAYSHAAIASAGPWLFTVLALGAMYPFFADELAINQLTNFRMIVVYNFGFSLILSAPIYMVITRYIADCIYRKDITHIPSVLLLSICLTYAMVLPVAIFYYGYYTELLLSIRLNAIANLFLVSLIWVLSIYLTALKDYNAITVAFGTGMVLAVATARWINDLFGEASAITGFNIGLTWIAFLLIGKIFAEYPYKLVRKIQLLPYFRRYWELALGGVFYNTAIWIDKCVMWKYAPEAVTLPNNMTHYPHYDGAMFLSFMTIVPAIAIFIFSIETNFFVHFQRFYTDINSNNSLSVIRANHRRMIGSLVDSARNFLIVQGTITVVVILISAKIFGWLHVNYLEIGIFRLGTLGSFFHALALFELVILSYFDCRKMVLILQGIFLFSNGIFTYITIDLGFAYYGYGYFLSSLLVFVIASLALYHHILKLPYHAFITNNISIKPVASQPNKA